MKKKSSVSKMAGGFVFGTHPNKPNHIFVLDLTAQGKMLSNEYPYYSIRVKNDPTPEEIIFERRAKALQKNTRGLECNITKEYLLELWKQQNGLCWYTKLPMVLTSKKENGKNNPYIVSVDRIDSSKGYIRGNLVLCCLSVNAMKSDLALEDFNLLVKAIYENIDRNLDSKDHPQSRENGENNLENQPLKDNV